MGSAAGRAVPPPSPFPLPSPLFPADGETSKCCFLANLPRSSVCREHEAAAPGSETPGMLQRGGCDIAPSPPGTPHCTGTNRGAASPGLRPARGLTAPAGQRLSLPTAPRWPWARAGTAAGGGTGGSRCPAPPSPSPSLPAALPGGSHHGSRAGRCIRVAPRSLFNEQRVRPRSGHAKARGAARGSGCPPVLGVPRGGGGGAGCQRCTRVVLSRGVVRVVLGV